MSHPSGYDVRLVMQLMKTSITPKIVADYAYRTTAMARFNPQKQLAANDLAWEVAA